MKAENGADGSDVSIFGVFDGHGQYGTECSTFAVDKLRGAIRGSKDFPGNLPAAFEESFPRINADMHAAKKEDPRFVDDRCSGTTAICVLMRGKELWVANVGRLEGNHGRREGRADRRL